MSLHWCELTKSAVDTQVSVNRYLPNDATNWCNLSMKVGELFRKGWHRSKFQRLWPQATKGHRNTTQQNAANCSKEDVDIKEKNLARAA